MSLNPHTLALLLAAAAFIVGLYLSWRAWQRLRMLADTPTARIRSAAQGYVELAGRAAQLDGEPVLGELSRTPCVWYCYRLEEKDSRHRWGTVDQGVSDSLFALEDGTGRCVVDPEGAEVIHTRCDVWYESGGGRRHVPAGLLGQLLDGVYRLDADHRHTEYRIEAGDELHLLGWFRTHSGSPEPPDLKRDTARLLEEWKQDPRRMALFDRDGDGHIDTAEWDAARRAARRRVERDWLERAAGSDVNLLCLPEKGDGVFLISALPEHRLQRRYRLQALGFLALAAGAGVWLRWLLG